MTEEYIDNENWVDMREDETGTVFARLSSVGYGNPGTLVVTFSDWVDFVIQCDRPRDTKSIPIGAHVMIRVRRTEDGLEGVAMWEPGGVPVPLASHTNAL